MPPTDPRYLASTVEDILIDYWAHRFADDPRLSAEEVTTDNYEAACEDFFADDPEPPADMETVFDDDGSGRAA